MVPSWLNKTLPELLKANAESDPEGRALQWNGTSMSWQDLDRRSDRLAAGLSSLGVGKGDVVSCQLPNTPDFLVLQHAVAKRRAIFNPIHMPYRSSEMEHILGFAGSKVLVVGPPVKGFSYLEMGLGLKSRLPSLSHLVVAGEEAGGAVPLAQLSEHSTEHRGSPPDAEDPFLILFTSGTTASPKATVHTHNMRMTNSWVCGGDMALSREDRMLCCSAFSHMWGILNYWSSVIYSCPQILMDRYGPEAFYSTADRGAATVVIGAPVHAIDLLGFPGLDSARLKALRLFALSGTVCPPELVRRLRRALPGCKPVIFWGMTETGGGCYTRLDDPPGVIETTTGRASGPCLLATQDEEGRRSETSGEGELLIRTPFGIQSYLKNPEATRESFTRDGWFRTGDLARIDGAGNVQILGRKKEEINRGGTKFLPQGVEEKILALPSVRMTAIVGMPDERLGERSVCFLVPAENSAAPTLQELCGVLEREGIAKFKWPERLEVVDSLPMTPTGKVQRSLLRKRLEP